MRDERALLTALPLAVLLYVLLLPDGDTGMVALGQFRLVLGADLAIRAALAIWGLRAYLASGQSTPLVLAIGLLAFVGLSVWRAVLATGEAPSYTLAVYGSLARAVFALALLSAMGPPLTVAARHRWRLLATGLAVATGLCAVGWALAAPIQRLAGGQAEPTRWLTHLVYEGATLLLTTAAAARLLRAPRPFDRRVSRVLLVGLALTAEQSLFLLTGEPWHARWWLGRLAGLAAAVVFGWAVARAAGAAAAGRRPGAADRVA